MADKMLEIKGLDQLQAQLLALSNGFTRRIGSAVRAEMELVMTQAKRRCPVKTGTLKGSGHVDTENESGGRITAVLLKFGGPAAPYAVPVHENLEAHHPTGEAKFLERPLLEAVPSLAERIAARVAKGAGAE